MGEIGDLQTHQTIEVSR